MYSLHKTAAPGQSLLVGLSLLPNAPLTPQSTTKLQYPARSDDAEEQTEDWESWFGLGVILDMASRILVFLALLHAEPEMDRLPRLLLGSFGEGGTTDVHIVVCVVC